MPNTVLLIDHHPKLRELLTTLLVTDGYDVLTCPCARNGHSPAAESRACDAVLANVAVPEGNWKFDYSGWYCLQPYLLAGKPVVTYALATDGEIGEIKDRLSVLGVPLLSHPIDLHAISRTIRRAVTAPSSLPGRSLAATG